MFIIVYILIIIAGITSFLLIVPSELEVLMDYQNARNRIRYELQQDINNLLICNVMNTEDHMLIANNFKRKLQTANHFSDPDMDKTKYFVDHLEKQLLQYSKNKCIPFKLFFHKSCFSNTLSILIRYDLTKLLFHLIETGQEEQLLIIDISFRDNAIVVEINNAYPSQLGMLEIAGFTDLSIDENKITIFIK